MAKQIKKTHSLTIEGNKYEKERQLRIQENKKRLSDLGVKNIVKSLTSLAESQQMKQITVKCNSHAGDVDYIPSAEDDSKDDDQQVGGSVIASKKQKRPPYIPPMSMNKVANLKKIQHMVTPNVSQKVSSTSNATKKNKTQQIVTMRDDDEDDEIFQACSRVDMEVHDVDQDDRYDDIDCGIGGRLHSDSYETGSQHESSDDDESIVGRRGPVAPTPLLQPRNREQIFIIHGGFSNQGKATRIIGETL
ncbi:hypothetical protein R6Q57_005785 [Mikania cordata]